MNLTQCNQSNQLTQAERVVGGMLAGEEDSMALGAIPQSHLGFARQRIVLLFTIPP